MKRRNFLFKSAVALASTAIIPSKLRTAYAIADRDLTNGITPFSFDPTKDIIPAPDDPALWTAIRSHKGLAWFPVISENGEIEWGKNPNYLDSELTIKNPEIYIQLGIKAGKSIYSQFEENAGRFMFVPQPQLAKEVWKKFIP